MSRLIELGRERGLRLHSSKRTMDWPGKAVLVPCDPFVLASLLDVGSGRGAFYLVVRCINEFADLPVTAIDRLDHRSAGHRGGATRRHHEFDGNLTAEATALPFGNAASTWLRCWNSGTYSQCGIRVAAKAVESRRGAIVRLGSVEARRES